MITEDYVGFETAKLLREKGFTANIHGMYDHDGKFCEATFTDVEPYYCCYAPTLQMARKWLREVHNIFIQVELYSKYDNYCFELFQNTHRLMIEHREVYNSYEEASEAAVKYCLENLI